MNENERQVEILQVLQEVGAVIRNDHLVYTSGKHGSTYINKDAVYPYPHMVAKLCEMIAQYFYTEDIAYDVVVGPEKGGIILAQWTAYYSQQKNDPILAVYAEKEKPQDSRLYREFGLGKPLEEFFTFHRGYDRLITGKKVLIVEDVLTTGGSVKKVVEAVRAIGGKVVGVGALCNRGEVSTGSLGNVPTLYALLNLHIESWLEDECPLCKEGKPVNLDVGKGREFIARKAQA